MHCLEVIVRHNAEFKPAPAARDQSEDYCRGYATVQDLLAATQPIKTVGDYVARVQAAEARP